MNPSPELIAAGAPAAIGLAIALLAWAAVDIGSRALARHRERFTERARLGLRELFLFVEPGHLYALNIGLLVVAAAGAGLAFSSWPLAMLAGALGGVLPGIALRVLRRRRLLAFERQLPDTLLMLAGGMKAGSGLTLAIQQLVAESNPPVSQEFDLLLREHRLGVPLDDALDNLQRRVPLQSVMLAVSAIRIATETGGHLAEALERTAQTLRDKLAMEGKIRALTSQGKLQALIVGSLPVFLILVLRHMEPEAMSLLFSTRVGWAALVVIALLEGFGVLVILRIVRIDV